MDNELLDNLRGLLIVLAMTALWSGSMDLFLVFVVQLVRLMGFWHWAPWLDCGVGKWESFKYPHTSSTAQYRTCS
jgi:hypothetical protein